MNKAVFITGAYKGTGYHIAERFASEGWNVFITSRNGDAAKRSATELMKSYGISAQGFSLSMHDEAEVKEIFAQLDQEGFFISTVVLNAADLGYGVNPAVGVDLFETKVEEFSSVLMTNVVGNFMIVRQAALRMKEHGGGAFVFISSNTSYRAIPGRTAYNASKGGINALMRSLAVDLGEYGIRSNAVLPGTIKTERWKQMGREQIVNGDLVPIGDISDYEDIANAVYFLGTEASKNITGAELIVDGGMSCQLYPAELRRWKLKE